MSRIKSILIKHNIYKKLETARLIIAPSIKKITVEEEGNTSYCTDDHKIVIGMKSIINWIANANLLNEDSDLEKHLPILTEVVGWHELEHERSSDFSKLNEFQENCYNIILNKLQEKQANGFIFPCDVESFKHACYNHAGELDNAIEDGRIERISVLKHKSHLNGFKFFRVLWWISNSNYKQDKRKKYETKRLRMNYCSFATFGIGLRSFDKKDTSMEKKQMTKSRVRLIKEAVNQPTPFDMRERLLTLVKMDADYLVEALVYEVGDKKPNEIPSFKPDYTSGKGQSGPSESTPSPIHQHSKNDELNSENKEEDGDGSSNDNKADNDSNSSSNRKTSKNDKDNAEESKGGTNKDKSSDNAENSQNGNVGSKDKEEGISLSDEEKSQNEANKNDKGNSNKTSEKDKATRSSSENGEMEESKEDIDESDMKSTDSDESDSTNDSRNSDSQKNNTGVTELELGDEALEEDEFDEDLFKEIVENAESNMETFTPSNLSEEEMKEFFNEEDEENNDTRKYSRFVDLDMETFIDLAKEGLYYDNPNHLLYKTPAYPTMHDFTITDVQPFLGVQEGEVLYNQRSGELDIESLYQLFLPIDARIFQKTISPTQSYAFDVLIDRSGSMSRGGKWSKALRALEICEKMLQNYALQLESFDYNSGKVEMHIIKEFDEKSEKSFSQTYAHHFSPSGSNQDGFSIRVATSNLLKRTEDNKILLILSDGLPNGQGTALEDIQDTALAVQSARERGVKVICVAIGESRNEVQNNYQTYQYIYNDDVLDCGIKELPLLLSNILNDIVNS